MANPIRIAIIDDHPLYREGTVQMLTEAEGLEVVAEGATAADALKVAQECLPDVILLDLRMPGGGVEAAANIADTCPHVRTIMLTASENGGCRLGAASRCAWLYFEEQQWTRSGRDSVGHLSW